MEEFKNIPGFDDYMVSNMGFVISKQRKVNRISKLGRAFKKTVNARVLTPAIAGSGYEFVCLRKNGKHHNRRIHRLVAELFVKGQKKGLVVHHKNGNKTDNRAVNLEWTSKQKNTQEYYKSNGHNFNTILISDIPIIKNRVDNGEECQLIAKEYGVTRNDISVLCKIIRLTGEELKQNK